MVDRSSAPRPLLAPEAVGKAFTADQRPNTRPLNGNRYGNSFAKAQTHRLASREQCPGSAFAYRSQRFVLVAGTVKLGTDLMSAINPKADIRGRGWNVR
jgi:hypothetical protein